MCGKPRVRFAYPGYVVWMARDADNYNPSPLWERDSARSAQSLPRT